MKTIMVAIDGSEIADRALEAACQLANCFGAEIVLINVEQGYPTGDLEPMSAPDNMTIDDILYASSATILARAQEKATTLGISKIRTHSGLGDPAGCILDLAKQERPELIAVGRRGRGMLSGLLLGSVSQKLVTLAPCKVLVVP